MMSRVYILKILDPLNHHNTKKFDHETTTTTLATNSSKCTTRTFNLLPVVVELHRIWRRLRQLQRLLQRRIAFCTIASINIFFRCPDWETAKSYVRSIFLSGIGDYQHALFNPKSIPLELFDAFGWVLAVFAVHELQRYFNLKDKILNTTTFWAITCIAMFWTIASFGISGPQFIYYQF